VTVPKGCNIGALHYAVERSRSRALLRPRERMKAVLEAEAIKYARAAENALAEAEKHMEKKEKQVAAKDRAAAKWLQQIALDYLQAVGGGEEALRARIVGIVP